MITPIPRDPDIWVIGKQEKRLELEAGLLAAMSTNTDRIPVAHLRWSEMELPLYHGHSIRLGRSAENDLVISDPRISRFHAIIEWNGSGFILRDLGSINGTHINGQRVLANAHLLRDGDRIELNKLVVTFEILRVAASEPVAVPPKPIPEETGSLGPCLEVLLGSEPGQRYPLWGDTITIGRACREATWEIRLPDPTISRPHARLENRDDGFYLNDLDSANGTRLNGSEVNQPVRLQHGDVLSMGEMQLVFRD
jgi:pSer/pThr/pTyr-binding forkhead associated (FHA) protein